MFVNSANWEDCRKYYQHCWVKFQEEGDKLFYIENVDPKYIYAFGVPVDDTGKGEEVAVDLTEGYTISYIIPKKAVFQHGPNACLLSRIPARMWKKGINKANTKFEILTNESGWVTKDFEIKVIQGFIQKPGYYKVDDALKEFTVSEHLQSAALSPRISINKKGNIYLDTIQIARYNPKNCEIITKKLFEPELKTHFQLQRVKVINSEKPEV